MEPPGCIGYRPDDRGTVVRSRAGTGASLLKRLIGLWGLLCVLFNGYQRRHLAEGSSGWVVKLTTEI